MSKLVVATFFIFFSLYCFANFERSVFKGSRVLEASDLVEDEDIKLICLAFKKYLILEKEEPGFLGKTIYFKIRSTSDTKSAPTECDQVKLETISKVDASGSNFLGLYKRFLFLQEPDELSARTKFDVFNLESNMKTYSGVKNNNTLLKIIPINNKTVGLEYFQRYLVNCDFQDQKTNFKCWNQFLKQIEVPDDVKIPYPSCPKAKTQKNYQVFLKVQVPDIQKQKRRFLWAKPICEISP